MPVLLPILFAGAQLVLVADAAPEFNIAPSCRAAATAAVKGRDETACKRDEQDARGKVQQQWGEFSADQRAHCVRLSTIGGSPSYVELLTCLELAKQSAALPPESKRAGAIKP